MIEWIKRAVGGRKREEERAAPRGYFKLPVVPPEEMMDRHREELQTIWGRVRVSEATRGALFDGPVRGLAQTVMTIPASEDHHDRGPGGLFEHTLAAAEEATRNVQSRGWEELNPPNPALAAMKERFLGYLAFLIALLHDVGKVFSVKVGAADPWAPQWDPMKETLWSYAVRNGARNKSLYARFVPGEARVLHEPLGMLLLREILTPEVVAFTGLGAAARVGAFLARSLRGEEVPSLEEQVARADKSAAAEAIEEGGPDRGTLDDLRVLFRHIRGALARGTLKANCERGQVFCGAKYTLVATPTGFSSLVEPVNRELKTLKRPALFTVRSHSRLFETLAGTGAAFGYGPKRDRVVVRADVGKFLAGTAGFLLSNHLLWEEEEGAGEFPGIFKEPIVIRENDKESVIEGVPGFVTGEVQERELSIFAQNAQDRFKRGEGEGIVLLGKCALIALSGPGAQELQGLGSKVRLKLPDRPAATTQGVLLSKKPGQPAGGSFSFVNE